jgi:hypothetical protein
MHLCVTQYVGGAVKEACRRSLRLCVTRKIGLINRISNSFSLKDVVRNQTFTRFCFEMRNKLKEGHAKPYGTRDVISMCATCSVHLILLEMYISCLLRD